MLPHNKHACFAFDVVAAGRYYGELISGKKAAELASMYDMEVKSTEGKDKS
jgi:hypothetical protein